MTTVTHGEIIELNVGIENLDDCFSNVSAVLLIQKYPYVINILGKLICILKRLERLQAN